MPALRLLVTAPPGTGKTTLCERVREQMAKLAAEPSAGFQLEGFLCHERRDASGRRVGFDLVSLEGQRAPLASVDGPPTGKMVGKYHVQVEEFEKLALPILERVAKGRGRRMLIFDEIGKMELYSDRFQSVMRHLLPNPDSDLHILGTVALNGGGLIAQSKKMQGVEVLEISASSREAAREDVTRRFAQALQAGAPQAAAAAPSATPAPAPAARSAALARLPGKEDFTFAEAPAPGQFTPVYPKDPQSNFASMNAGDYLLYVGGAAINRAFAEALQGAGQSTKGRFELLHEALLEAGSRTPGKLCWLRQADLFPARAAGRRTSTCDYCKSRAECWETSRVGWEGQQHCSACWAYYADWALQDLSAVCGLVPAAGDGSGVTGELLAALRPVGLVAVSVFRSRKRPRGSERNVAMVYVVGPNCGGTRKKGRREVDRLSPEAFLQVLEALGHAVAQAVAGYNAERAGMEDAGGPLPRIDELRVCLASGGVYRHPDASKEGVAHSLLKGVARGHARGGVHAPRFDFAWDDNVFRIAWDKMVAEEGHLP